MSDSSTMAYGLSVVKNFIKWLTKKLFSIIPSGKIILFESSPDFTDNTYPVYLELKKRLPDYKAENLREFVVNVSQGRDVKREGRRKWRDISNMHQDGKSSERVADFVMWKIGEAQNTSLI